ncbi:MAG: TonB-dependent receptor [Bacteroidota bacterium]
MDTTTQVRRWRSLLVYSALLLGIALLGSPALLAQTGVIAGTVVEQSTGETLPGVNVVIDGTTQGSSTSLDGDYRIGSVAPGTYTLVFTYIGFTTQRVTGVEVTANEVTTVDLAMGEEPLELGDGQEVVVEARLIRDNEFALLADRARAAQVSDAISLEEIGRRGAGDAAEAMASVTGASVVDGKYVYVRGLGDRYSNTTLNGATLPSADPDRKAFQLDLLPSGLIENIVTLKTFTPDKPGDFAGGLVDIATKSFPEQFTFSLGLSATYDAQSSFSDVLTYGGSGTDWLGYDDGQRSLPDALADPSVEIPGQIEARDINLTNEERLAAAEESQRLTEAFSQDWALGQETVPFNQSVSLSLGGPATFLGGQLGYTGSFNYGRSFSWFPDATNAAWVLAASRFGDPGDITETDRLNNGTIYSNDLAAFEAVDFDSLDAALFRNTRSVEEVNWGGSGTVSYRPVRNHEFGLTMLRTQSGAKEALDLGGINIQSSTRALRSQAQGYTERSLSSVQLRGEHLFGTLRAEWKGALSNNQQDEPDLRLFTFGSNRVVSSEGVIDTTFALTGAGGQEPTRFFRDLNDDTRNASLDLSVPFGFWDGLRATVKAGGAFVQSERRFTERRFIYREGRSATPFSEFDGDIAAYFNQGNVPEEQQFGELSAYNLGLFLEEQSLPRNSYDADQSVVAGYVMVDLPITETFRFVGGARLETTDLNLISDGFEAQRDQFEPAELDSLFRADQSYTDLLPSANVVYALADNMNLRAAWTQTLARPTFRELAPYESFELQRNEFFGGNPDLERTLITNYDLRWEWFTRPGELFAISTFYKNFDSPIERTIRQNTGGESQFITVRNVDRAQVYGAEFEMRKRMDGLTALPVLRNMQFGGNLSLVYSVADIPGAPDDLNTELGNIIAIDPDAEDSRPLVGQSPYIINLDATYQNIDRGTTLSVLFNVFGERLSLIAENATPDVFEQPRPQLDVTASQAFDSIGLTVKAGVSNLLGSDFEETQTYRGETYVYRSYELPRRFSLGVTYSL